MLTVSFLQGVHNISFFWWKNLLSGVGLFFFLRILKNNFIFVCAGSLSLWGLLSSCGARASHHGGFSCCRAWALGHTGFSSATPGLQNTGSVVVAYRLSSAACGIFPDQGSNPCLLHWQVYSLPLSQQGNPCIFIMKVTRWGQSILTANDSTFTR